MDRNEIERLIYRILTTEDAEIDCGQVSELIARYVDMEVAGADAPGLLPLVYQHLRQCNACSDLHDALYEMAMLEERGKLPEADTLLDEIVSAPPSFDRHPEASPLPPGSDHTARSGGPPADTAFRSLERNRTGPSTLLGVSSWFQWGGWAVAAAALVILAIFGVWGWRQSTTIADLKSDMIFIARADRTVLMQGTEGDPDARGYVFVNDKEQRGLLVIDGLNQPDPDKVYQMWVEYDDGKRISAGTFVVEADEQGRVWLKFGGASTQFTSLAITPEEKPGSLRPTSSPVCVWGERQT